MKIFNIDVYGLEESIIRSGYPMIAGEICDITNELYETLGTKDSPHIKRAITLGNAKGGSGHDCFLKGIIVQMDVTAPQYWWQQAQRYHWFDIISSQSKMHKILQMDLEECCPNVSSHIINESYECIALYKDNYYKFEDVLDNLPMGLEYTAGISTNYLQLKTMYNQRRGHKLSQWQYFCDWCETLPYFKELCLGG